MGYIYWDGDKLIAKYYETLHELFSEEEYAHTDIDPNSCIDDEIFIVTSDLSRRPDISIRELLDCQMVLDVLFKMPELKRKNPQDVEIALKRYKEKCECPTFTVQTWPYSQKCLDGCKHAVPIQEGFFFENAIACGKQITVRPSNKCFEPDAEKKVHEIHCKKCQSCFETH